MRIVVCEHSEIYTLIKQHHTLTEYPAHSIALIKLLDITIPLPIPIAIDTTANILIPRVHNPTPSFLSSIIGMLYMSTQQSSLLYVSSYEPTNIPSSQPTPSDKHAEPYFYTPLILTSHPSKSQKDEQYHVQNNTNATAPDTTALDATPNANHADKSQRPFYFDILSTIPHTHTIDYYHNPSIHTLMRVCARIWESHLLQLLLIPPQVLALPTTPHALSKTIQSYATAYMPSTLPHNITKWLLQAKHTWKLSSTEFQQLQVLLEGYVQQGNTALHSTIHELIHNEINTQSQGKKCFNTCKSLLLAQLQ